MKANQAIDCFLEYHKMNSKRSTVRNYEFMVSRFCAQFGDREIGSFTAEEILAFLTRVTEGSKQSTKRLRYSLLSAFFNFIKGSIDPHFHNPCDSPILRKLFREPKPTPWQFLEKEVIDEMIFRTGNVRNRLMLELMARSGMRVGEVLKLTALDIDDRKALIRDPKSGKEAQAVFLPQKLADRLRKYIRENKIQPDARIFPITYAAARLIVKKQGRWSELMSDPMTYVDTPPHMHLDPGRHLRSFRKYCYVILTCRPPKGTWEKSVMRRRCGGSTTFIGNILEIPAEVLMASALLYQISHFQINQRLFRYPGNNRLQNTQVFDNHC